MIKDFENYINKAVEDKVFPGCNIAVITKNNQGYKEYFKSFGLKAILPEEEVNNIDTMYDMASCTKVISTVSCLLKLVEQGKVGLYDKVAEYLPEFLNKNINIWNLTTHTSGLPPMLKDSHEMTRDEIYTAAMKVIAIYEIGTKIVYSDINFLIIGLIVEKVSGMTLDKFAKKYIFDPLDMKDTMFNPTDIKRCAPTEDRGDHIDRGYVHDEMAHNFDGVAGHAGLFSTVKDLSHFGEMILNDGMYKGKKVFSKAVIDLLFRPQVQTAMGNSLRLEQRSIGWIIDSRMSNCGELASPETICHTGFTGTNIVIDRKTGLCFIMLANRVHPTRKNTKIIPFRRRVANYVYAHIEDFQ